MAHKRAVYVTEETDPIFGRRAWSSRYDSVDRAMQRPIHRNMSVAPPWATRLRLPRHPPLKRTDTGSP